MKKLSKVCISLLSMAAVSCSSIVSKSSYPVSIQSNPSGLSYSIKNAAGEVVSTGKTPDSVTLNASAGFFKAASYTIAVKRGSTTVGTTTLIATMDGWYIGNLLFGGVIGMLVVDPATGSMWALPDNVNVQTNSVSGIEAPQLNVALLSDLTTSQREKLVKI